MKCIRPLSLLPLVLLLVASQAGHGQETQEQLKKDALTVLQEKVAERGNPGAGETKSEEMPPGWPLTFEEIESLYLKGEISARMFQKYIVALQKMPTQPQPPPITPQTLVPPQDTEKVHDQAIEVLRHAQADPNKNPKPGPAIQADQLPLLNQGDPAEVPPPVDEDFIAIEKKMDQLLAQKTQREKVSSSNQVDLATLEKGEGMTQRERLNQLLRLYAFGKVSEEDYKRVRAKIMAEPDPPPRPVPAPAP